MKTEVCIDVRHIARGVLRLLGGDIEGGSLASYVGPSSLHAGVAPSAPVPTTTLLFILLIPALYFVRTL